MPQAFGKTNDILTCSLITWNPINSRVQWYEKQTQISQSYDACHDEDVRNPTLPDSCTWPPIEWNPAIQN